MNRPNLGTVLICSNYAWTIINFRMSLIKTLSSQGYRVVVVTQYDGYEAQLADCVAEVRPLFISRRGLNPFTDFITILNLIYVLFQVRPKSVVLFTIKPVVYGAIAAKILNIRAIVMITGLGTAFIADSWITRLVKVLYRFSLSSVSTVFFQNRDDKEVFLGNRLVLPDVCKLSPGSGIDLEDFQYRSVLPTDNITFILIARMLWDKGVGEFVEAARSLRLRYPSAKFQLLGAIGVENRTAISDRMIADWISEGVIDYLGETDNVKPFIESACCVVLPSYREGTPRVLLEAASIGRPIVATDVPGCREVVENGVTGLLCRAKDPLDLSEKMEQMINFSYEDRREMGNNGRAKMEKEFDVNIVNELFLDAI